MSRNIHELKLDLREAIIRADQAQTAIGNLEEKIMAEEAKARCEEWWVTHTGELGNAGHKANLWGCEQRTKMHQMRVIKPLTSDVVCREIFKNGNSTACVMDALKDLNMLAKEEG